MNSTDKIILEIVKEAITKEPTLVEDDYNLDEIYNSLKFQAVSSLAYNWLQQSEEIKQERVKEWAEEIFHQISYWYKMLDAQDKLVKMLTSHGYKCVIMKGFANAILYPKPELRISGDIDFLVKEEQYEEIYNLLVLNGYKLMGEKYESKHHIGLKKDKIIFELHRQPGGTRRKHRWQVEFFQQGLKNAEMVTLKDYSFPVLPKLHNGIMLLVHIRAHFKGGIGLRHLLDWIIYAEKYVTDEFWELEMKSVAKEYNVEKLAAVMSRCGQIYFGLLRGRKWCSYIENDICGEVINYLFEQGDFGRKADIRDAQLNVIAESSKIKGFLRRVNLSSQYSMPIIKRYPILRPVGWVYQIGKYVSIIMHKEDSLQSLGKDILEGKKRRDFFIKLGVQDW